MVGRDHPIYTLTVWAAWGEVQEELVTDPAIRRETRTEAKGWKEFVCVVVLYDVPDGSYGSEVLVGVPRRVVIVKGGGGGRVSIGGGEVDGNREAEFHPSLDVIQESWPLFQKVGTENQGARVLVTFLLAFLLGVDQGHLSPRLEVEEVGKVGLHLPDQVVVAGDVPVLNAQLQRSVVVVGIGKRYL